MFKISTAFSALFLFIIPKCFSQEAQHLVKVNVVPLFNKIYEVQYEYVFNESSSLQLGIGFGNDQNNSVDDFQEFHLETFGRNLNGPKNTELIDKTFTINLDYRYYFSEQDAPRGLYLSPSIQYINHRESYYALERESFGDGNGNFAYNVRADEQSFTGVNIRAMAGFQVLIAQRIVLNPYFGAGFLMGNSKDYIFRNDDDVKGVGFVFGANAGIAF